MSTESRTIKTPITDTGMLRMDGTNTGLGSLMSIGAMYHTARRDKGQVDYDIQTDADGLRMLHSDTDSAITSICLSLESLGKLLAYADHREIGAATFANLGWLLVSFSELSIDLQNARDLIEDNIARHREQGRDAS